jgi:hypothetical protein
MHFSKLDLPNLMEAYMKFLRTFYFVVPYSHALKNAWPKQVP